MREGEEDHLNDFDYMMARHYSAQLGRFTSPDLLPGSLWAPQTLNRYAYVGGNPVNFVDPFGLERARRHDATAIADSDRVRNEWLLWDDEELARLLEQLQIHEQITVMGELIPEASTAGVGLATGLSVGVPGMQATGPGGVRPQPQAPSIHRFAGAIRLRAERALEDPGCRWALAAVGTSIVKDAGFSMIWTTGPVAPVGVGVFGVGLVSHGIIGGRSTQLATAAIRDNPNPAGLDYWAYGASALSMLTIPAPYAGTISAGVSAMFACRAAPTGNMTQ